MLHIVGCAQIRVSFSTTGDSVSLKFSDKQQHLTVTLSMVNIPLAGRRVLGSGTLALPMEQTLIDGVIVIHGCGRVTPKC